MNDQYNQNKSSLSPLLTELTIARQNIEIADKLTKEAKEKFQQVVNAIGEKSKDSEYATDVMCELYWKHLDVNVSWIAEAFNITKGGLSKIVNNYPSSFRCILCGAVLRLKSRSALQKLTRSPQLYSLDTLYSRHPCLCSLCQKDLRRQEDEKWDDDDKEHKERYYKLASMPYAEYLQTPEWQERRNKQLKSAGYKCQVCNKGDMVLHVHHRTYERRGCEYFKDLIVLCAQRHTRFHDKLPDLHKEGGGR